MDSKCEAALRGLIEEWQQPYRQEGFINTVRTETRQDCANELKALLDSYTAAVWWRSGDLIGIMIVDHTQPPT